MDPERPDPAAIARGGELLRAGKLVAFPTETVYGIGANADDPDAVARLRKAKRRDEGKPFTLHLADAEDLARHVTEIPPMARRLIDRYWPGPLTLVLPGKDGESVGVRVPATPATRALLREAGVPVIASSANRVDEPPACDAATVATTFGAEVALVLDGGETPIRQSSCVVRVDGGVLEVLREGILSRAQVERAASRLFLCICTGNSCRSPMAKFLFRKRLAEKLGAETMDLRRHGVRVESAGLVALGGGGASSPAVHVMREYGCDLGRHEVRRVEPEEIDEAERIFVMTEVHRRRLLERVPEAAGKVELLSPEGREIPDPIWGTEADYRACAEEIDRCVRQRVRVIMDEGEEGG